MKRHEAAEKVNDALVAAGASKALQDPKAKGFTVSIDGQEAVFEFKHSVRALEQRKHDLAVFRAKLVEELTASSPLLAAPAEKAAPAAAPSAKA